MKYERSTHHLQFENICPPTRITDLDCYSDSHRPRLSKGKMNGDKLCAFGSLGQKKESDWVVVVTYRFVSIVMLQSYNINTLNL